MKVTSLSIAHEYVSDYLGQKPIHGFPYYWTIGNIRYRLCVNGLKNTPILTARSVDGNSVLCYDIFSIPVPADKQLFLNLMSILDTLPEFE